MTLFSQLVPNASLVTADSTQTLTNKTLNSPILVTPNLGVASANSITANLGAVGTPAYTFTGDLNTGMWSPAADTVAVSTAGAERMRINSAGELLVGTTSSQNTRLTVQSATGDIATFDTTDTTAGIKAIAVRSIATSGTGTPTFALRQWRPSFAGGSNVGEFRFDGLTTTSTYVEFAAIYANAGTNTASGAPTSLTFKTMNTSFVTAERMRISADGNVGIGTSAPGTKLEVTGDITQTWAVSMDRFIGSKFSTSYEVGLHLLEATRETRVTSKAADGTGLISLYTGVTPTERMRINSSGDVGIGTSAPGAKLEVSSTSAGATVEVLRLNNPGGGANTAAQIKFFAAGTNYASITGGYGAAAPQMTFNMPTASAGNYVWQGNSVEQMRLDASGNLGIGTSAPTARLSVVPTSNPASPTGGLQTSIGEASDNAAYQMRMGYILDTTYKSVINSISGGVGADLLLNPSGGSVIVGGNLTLSTKIIPNVQSIASAATITPNANTDTQVSVAALAVAATISIPSGTALDGQKLMLRFKDNGTGRALTWITTAGGYRVIGLTLPTTTTATKTLYIGCIYNALDGFWDVIAKGEQA